MARSKNSVSLIGNVGSDVELQYLSTGTAAVNLRVATNERRKKDGEWVDHTEWHNVVVYGRLAEIVGDYVSRGSAVAVDGRLRTRTWETNEGETRYVTEILADEIIFMGGNGAVSDADGDDDLPF